MKIATIIITYNRKDVLVQCIESILKSEVKSNGIIVVDNASTDGTRKKIEEEFKEVTLIRLNENKGPAGGAEAGQRFAIKNGFDAIWMLDDDNIVERGALKVLLDIYHTLKEKFNKIFLSSVAYGDLKFSEPLYNLLKYNFKTGLTRKIEEKKFKEEFFEYNIAPMHGLFLPREVFASVGFFNGKLWGWYDDTEFVLRAQKNGFRGFAVPSSKIYHPVGFRKRVKIFGKNFTILSGRPVRMYLGTRNNIITQKQILPKLNFYLIFLPLFILKRGLSILLFYDEKDKFLKNFILGIIDGIKGNLEVKHI